MEIFKEFKLSRLAIYTVIMGNYDYLKDPAYIDENCDYICFTNRSDLKSDTWKIIVETSDEYDDIKWQRRHKVLAHEYLKDYDFSIYVDGNVTILGSLREYVQKESKGKNILCLQHPYRNNIYEEAAECISLKKDDPEVITDQINQYRADGCPQQSGLIVSSIIFRKHTDPTIIKVMGYWWNEICYKSYRDQLSFNYVCWKYNFQYDESLLKPWKSPYWKNPGVHNLNIFELEDQIVDYIQYVDYLGNAYQDKLQEEVNRLVAENKVALESIANLQKECEVYKTQSVHSQEALSEFMNSRSWKVTAPLRIVSDIIKNRGISK
jgi:Protein of unknown function (DUF616).